MEIQKLISIFFIVVKKLGGKNFLAINDNK